MRRKSIKKSTACALMICAALCFCACGANTNETSDANVSENPAAGETQQESDISGENTEAPAENEGQESDTDNGAGNDTSVSNMEYSVTVAILEQEDVNLTTDDGTLYYTITCSYPVVSIAGNEAAAEKINADILSRVDSFHTAVNQSAEMAKEEFEYLLGDDDEYTPYPYSSSLYYTVTRADNNVISFTENGYEYMGGAHGMPYSTGINYDTNTGELITFTDLSDDPDAFHADTLAYNQALAQTDYYSEQLFNTDDITNGTLEDVLYTDGAWYLSPFGLTFMSPPYALAPYASGTLEFTIPYNDLEDMGFKEAYTYTGRQITKLLEDSSYARDLNGDGNDDAIVYHSEWLDSDTGNFIVRTNLTINDVNFSESGTDDVKEQFISPSSLQFYVYDMDANDNYLELAGVYVEWTQNGEDDDYSPTSYSRLFRYTEDGSLAYLGQVTGDITDPLVSTDGL